jgi:multimeric flavodoxin WrbA
VNATAKKVLGLMGSPRRDGIAAQLLDAALEGARSAGAETERLDLAAMRIGPCMECRHCEETAACQQTRDDMGAIYSRVRQVDAIALSSPVFFMGVTAQTKAMIDRCQCFWVERYQMKRRAYEGRERPKGLFLSCAGSPKPTIFEPSLHIAKAFFAAIDYQYVGEVLLGHTDDPGLAPRKEAALAQAREAGGRLV